MGESVDVSQRVQHLWRLSTGPTARKGYLAVADQALVSGTNFAVGILLANCCTKSEYGAYVLAVSVMLFLHGIHVSLITSPLPSVGSRLDGAELRRYFSSLFVIQTMVALTLAAGVAIGGLWIRLRHPDSVVALGLLGLSAALLFLQGREFFRRLLFCRLRAGSVLINDLVFCPLLLATLACLWWSQRLSAPAVFLAMGGCALVGCGVGLYQAREHVRWRSEGWRQTVQMNKTYAGWTLFGCCMSFSATQLNVILLGYITGAASAGQYDAARNALGPVQLGLIATANVAEPRAARAFGAGGPAALLRFMRRLLLAMALLFLPVCAATALFGENILQVLYGDRYVDQLTGLRYFAIFYALSCMTMAPTLVANVTGHPHVATLCRAAAAIPTVLCTLMFVRHSASAGAVQALVVGELIICVMTWWWTLRLIGKGLPVGPALRRAHAADEQT